MSYISQSLDDNPKKEVEHEGRLGWVRSPGEGFIVNITKNGFNDAWTLKKSEHVSPQYIPLKRAYNDFRLLRPAINAFNDLTIAETDKKSAYVTDDVVVVKNKDTYSCFFRKTKAVKNYKYDPENPSRSSASSNIYGEFKSLKSENSANKGGKSTLRRRRRTRKNARF